MTLLSWHRFRSNEVRLWLSVIAYNLGNPWRRLVLPKKIGHWSLTILQQRLVKTGGRLTKHARYDWLMLAESHLTRRLFASMLCRIAGLPSPGGQASRRPEQTSATREVGEGKVPDESVGKAAVSGLGILLRGRTDPFRGPWKHPALKTRLDLAFRGGRGYFTGGSERENGNSGS